MTKQISLFISFAVLLLASSHSRADLVRNLTDSYNHYYLGEYTPRLSRMPNRCAGCSEQTPDEAADNQQCTSFYNKVTDDGTISVHVSFGYFDDSEGGETMEYRGERFAPNASMDEIWFNVFRSALTAHCHGHLGMCGFRQTSEGRFEKMVRTPAGRQVRFVVGTEYPSVTPNYLTNVGERADEQQRRSALSRSRFMTALRTDDAVFYIGHSRNGGGPDFYPPRLNPNGVPNYVGYYQAQHPGVNDLLSSIRARGEAPPLLGMMSCLSEVWFGRALHQVSPNTAYIFTESDRLVGMNNHFMAMVAAIDGLTRFQCSAGMSQEIRAMAMEPNVEEVLRNVMNLRTPIQTNLPRPVIAH